MRIRKRCFTLLEVLIAFALIVLCAFPLIYPHAAIYKEQRKFLEKERLDHLVNLLFADFYERLQKNEISWSELQNEEPKEIPKETLTALNQGQTVFFRGFYQWKEKKHKPSKEEDPIKVYLYRLHFHFFPLDEATKDFAELVRKEGRQKEEMRYEYLVFLMRNLTPQKEASAPAAKEEPNE